jgi:hypothetical protein
MTTQTNTDEIAVATARVKPNMILRPRAPGHDNGEIHFRSAGRIIREIAVAKSGLKPIRGMRPRAPGQ